MNQQGGEELESRALEKASQESQPLGSQVGGLPGPGCPEVETPNSGNTPLAFPETLTLSPHQPLPPGLRSSRLSPAPKQIGRFQIREFLEDGAYGAVYRAYDPQLDREVALKVAKPQQLASPGRIERFLGEAKAIANLRHPHLVPVFDSGREGEQLFIAEALIRGQTLARRLRELPAGRFLDQGEGVRLVRQLAEALAYAHRRGIIHRDIKPANIILDDQGEPVLVDFGLAGRQNEEERPRRDQGRPIGTPAYMAPEQARGETSPASDQYSLGCVLFEWLTGQPPFQGPPELQLFLHQTQPPPRLRSLNKTVSPDLEAITLKCLQKDPACRYPGMAYLAEDLRRFQAREPVLARPPGPLERLAKWARRRPALALLYGVVLFGLVALSVLSYQLFTSWAQAEDARKKMIDNYRLAAQAVDQFFSQMGENSRLKEHDLDELRKDLLERAVVFHDKFVNNHSDDPEVRLEQGRAYLRLALMLEQLRRPDEAACHDEHALDIFASLLAAYPSQGELTLGVLNGLGKAWNHRGKLAFGQKQYSEAETAFRQALEFREQLVQADPNKPDFQADAASTWNNLGSSFNLLNLPGEAEVAFNKALQLQKPLVEAFPDQSRFRNDLAMTWYNLGRFFAPRNKNLAREHYQNALGEWKKLCAEQTNSGEFLIYLAWCSNDLANLLPFQDALKVYQRALEILQDQKDKHPGLPSLKSLLATTNFNIGLLEFKGLLRNHGNAYVAMALQNQPLTAATCFSFFLTVSQRQNQEKAFRYLETAVVLSKELNAKYPNWKENNEKLALFLTRLGQFKKIIDGQPGRRPPFQRAGELQRGQ